MCQNDVKKKVWRNGEIAHVRQLTSLYVKYGEDNVMEWGSISNSGTQSLVFSDDVTAEKSIRINNDAYGAIVSAQIQPNVANDHSAVDYDPKHTAKAV